MIDRDVSWIRACWVLYFGRVVELIIYHVDCLSALVRSSSYPLLVVHCRLGYPNHTPSLIKSIFSVNNSAAKDELVAANEPGTTPPQ